MGLNLSIDTAIPTIPAHGSGGPATVQPTGTRALIEVQGLTVSFPGEGGIRNNVVSGLNYRINAGETLGVVGESGCGKTMTSLALMGLVPNAGQVTGSIMFGGRNLVDQKDRDWRRMRGRDVAMIFQEPMTAMNPVMTVGRQIAEVLIRHEGLSRREAADRSVGLLEAVGIPSPRRRAEDYPHQLSGGMRQRAMIAMALVCKPRLLVADEPTTALDVTIQAQILDLILELQEDTGMAVQFITHNLAVVSELAHHILVMYAGRGVEYAPADTLFERPLHPYTRGLIATLPDPDHKVATLPVIPGGLRSSRSPGCPFAGRCALASDICRAAVPPMIEVEAGHHVACVKVSQ